MATHSSIHAREIPWTEEPGWLWSKRLQKNQAQISDEIPKSGNSFPHHSLFLATAEYDLKTGDLELYLKIRMYYFPIEGGICTLSP